MSFGDVLGVRPRVRAESFREPRELAADEEGEAPTELPRVVGPEHRGGEHDCYRKVTAHLLHDELVGLDLRRHIGIAQGDLHRGGLRGRPIFRRRREYPGGAREHEPADSLLTRHREDVAGAEQVDVEHPLDVPDAQFEPAGGVEHNIGSGHRALEPRTGDVALHDPGAAGFQVLRPRRFAREDRDLPIPLDEGLDQGTADEPRAPRDEGPHPSPFAEHDRQDVRILQRMIEADLLSGELGGRAPHVRISKPLPPIAMDRIAHHADVGARLHDERVRHVRVLPLRLQKDPHEPEGLVHLVLEFRDPHSLLRGDRHELPSGELGLESLDVLLGDQVDLIDHDEGLNVHAVPGEDIDQLVLRDVLAHDDRPVQVAPLPADLGDEVFVELRQLDGGIHPEAAAVRLRQGDVGGPLVQSDPREAELFLKDVHVGLEDVDHEQDEVAASGDGKHFLAAAAALRRAADQPRHVEDLDLSAAVLQQPGDHIERCEVIRRDRARGVRDRIEERRLADGWESNEADGRVPALLDRIAGASAAGLEPTRLLLILQARDFRLQLPDVVLRRLVVGRLLDLVLDRLDLLLEGGHGRWKPPSRAAKNLSAFSFRRLLESDYVSLRIAESRDSAETLFANRFDADAAGGEFRDDALDVLDEELHVPAVAPGMRFPFQMQGDGAPTGMESGEIRILVYDCQVEWLL